MREHRVRIPPPLPEGRTRLSETAAHHLLRVLRLRPGDALVAFDGEGLEADAQVLENDVNGAFINIGVARRAARAATRALTLAIALLKGDKLSDVVRMGTELGVMRFVPVLTARCVATDLSPAKLARLRRVAEEAARQSLRAHVPSIDEPVALAGLRWHGAALVADPAAPAAWVNVAARDALELTVISGPEGGFRVDEVEALVAQGAERVRLVPSILRAETAPIAVAAAYLLAGGD
jgi:16S rRNA (uracil1498-N3)-methyltransferase